MRLQPSMAGCIEARSVRSPCTPSARSRRRASARLSSRRTRARTLCPLASRNSVRLRPMPPTAPAAPVTRIGLSCVCFVVMSLTSGYVSKDELAAPACAGVFFLCGDLTLARRQSGLPHDEALDPRDDDDQHRHDHDIACCRGLQPAHGEIRLETMVQGKTDERHAGRGDQAGNRGDRGSDQFRGKGHLLAPGNGVIIYTTYNLYVVKAIGPMPRTADPELPHRILKAADALWQSGGEEAVTIRGVAAEAATTTPTVYSYYADREALLTALRALAFQRFSAHLKKSRDFQDACARHLEFGTSHPRDYELLYGRGWMERVTGDAQRGEIERYTTHLVRAGVDESRAAHIAYPIMMMLHGVVMHRLLNKKQSPLGRAIAAACLEACMTLLARCP